MTLGKLLIAASCLISVNTAMAEEGVQSGTPIFSIETGMHTAIVEHISSDAAGRYVVTCSRDKTIRVWGAKNGTLLSVLRPPIGQGKEGRIYAVAISPDGELVAAGGSLGQTSKNSYSVYIFQRSTGQIKSRISGIPSVVYNVKFSPDSARIGVGLKEGGIRVFRVQSGLELSSDKGYGDSVTGIDFDGNGRLLASALDGNIRIYDKMGSLAKQIHAGPEKPYSVRFSPDGSRIAVGFMNAIRVDVLSGQDLSPVARPSTANITGKELSAVAWTSDGASVCAAGHWLVDGVAKVRCWSAPSYLSYRDAGASGAAVYDLTALPKGRLAFAGGDPSWGVLEPSGRPAVIKPSYTADFRDGGAAFRTDETGVRVMFGYRNHGADPALFSLEERSLVLNPKQDPTLRGARTTASNIRLSGWKDSYDVLLNGRPLTLTAYERSRSMALAPNESWFVLGTARYLRCFDASGTQRWQAAAPGETQQVNISGDGRLVLASFSDGSIRWFRADRGTELLALFPHADQARWVAWTPEGFYDASPRGEELFGWQVNHGLDQAPEFFPASRYRDRFRQPGPVLRALRFGMLQFSPAPPSPAGVSASSNPIGRSTPSLRAIDGALTCSSPRLRPQVRATTPILSLLGISLIGQLIPQLIQWLKSGKQTGECRGEP